MSIFFSNHQQIQQLQEDINELKAKLAAVAAWPDAWIDLKRACSMKGVAYNSVKGVYWKKPRGGNPDGILNNRHYWRPETIREWILQTDIQLKQLYKRREKALDDTSE